MASLNYLLSSHVWQQDHNGFSHQDPGFIDHAVNKKAEVIRVYLPPDANTLLSVMEHCLGSRDYVNIVVSGKQPSPTWLGPAEAAHHCQRGLGIWEFAGSEVPGEEPDVVLACAGDVPTVETVAAAELLKAGRARAEDPGGQRGGPDAAPGRQRAPARPDVPGLRRDLHGGQAHHLRLPRLSRR